VNYEGGFDNVDWILAMSQDRVAGGCGYWLAVMTIRGSFLGRRKTFLFSPKPPF